MACQCEQCQKNIYNPDDFLVTEQDFANLDRKRPFGFSGHLRAKNEGLALALCIESCIDFLDELIITYNDSEDDTEKIILEYAKKYPDKIRVYHYKPWVYFRTKVDVSLNPSADRDQEMHPIHNSANFSNFGYTKIRFQYYVKIDGDQIYFTEKYLEIKAALGKKLFLPIPLIFKITPPKILTLYLNLINKIFQKTSLIHRALNVKQLIKLYRFFAAPRCAYVLGGIELSLSPNFENFTIRRFYKDLIYPNAAFNGCARDHLIIEPQSKFRYELSQTKSTEVFELKTMLYARLGLHWLHVGDIKAKKDIKSFWAASARPEVSLETLEYDGENMRFQKDGELDYLFQAHKYNFQYFFEKDKQYLTPGFRKKFLPPLMQNVKKLKDG